LAPRVSATPAVWSSAMEKIRSPRYTCGMVAEKAVDALQDMVAVLQVLGDQGNNEAVDALQDMVAVLQVLGDQGNNGPIKF